MKTDKKELILDALEKLMDKVPYSEISVEDIAVEAGIGKGSIYYYFKSKNDIIYSLIDQSYRRAVREYFDNIRSRGGVSALEKIKTLFLSIIKEDFGENERNLLITLKLNDDTLLQSKMKTAAIQEIAPVLSDLLEQGIREKTIKTDTPHESSEIIVSVLTVLLDDVTFPKNGESMKNKLKIFAKVLETCLQTDTGSFDFLYTPFEGGNTSF